MYALHYLPRTILHSYNKHLNIRIICALKSTVFAKIFSPGKFSAVWRYMEGYVENEGSTEPGQYYMKGW